MARIAMTSGFTLVPEGTHVFRIYNVTYDEEFGKLIVFMVNAQGITHKENFSLKDKNDQPNEKAYNAFSYFAKNALNDFTVEDIDHTDLIGCYIRAEVIHNKQPSNKDPNKILTFANLGDKSPADGFDTTPVPVALSMGTENAPKAAPKAAPKTATPTAQKSGGLNLDDLLGN